MSDWPNPNEATWLSAAFTFVASVVAIGIALTQGWSQRRADRQARAARAWQQALLVEPVILHVSSKLDLLPEMFTDALAKELDGRAVESFQVREINDLAVVLNNIDALDEPLRTNLLRLVAWGRALNNNIAYSFTRIQLEGTSDRYLLNQQIVMGQAFRNHLGNLQNNAKASAKALAAFINTRGEAVGVASYIATRFDEDK